MIYFWAYLVYHFKINMKTLFVNCKLPRSKSNEIQLLLWYIFCWHTFCHKIEISSKLGCFSTGKAIFYSPKKSPKPYFFHIFFSLLFMLQICYLRLTVCPYHSWDISDKTSGHSWKPSCINIVWRHKTVEMEITLEIF